MIFRNIPLDRRMYRRYNPSRFTKPFSILFAIIVGAVVQVKKIFRKNRFINERMKVFHLLGQ